MTRAISDILEDAFAADWDDVAALQPIVDELRAACRALGVPLAHCINPDALPAEVTL